MAAYTVYLLEGKNRLCWVHRPVPWTKLIQGHYARWLCSCGTPDGRKLTRVESWAWLGSYPIGTRHVVMVEFLRNAFFFPSSFYMGWKSILKLHDLHQTSGIFSELSFVFFLPIHNSWVKAESRCPGPVRWALMLKESIWTDVLHSVMWLIWLPSPVLPRWQKEEERGVL